LLSLVGESKWTDLTYIRHIQQRGSQTMTTVQRPLRREVLHPARQKYPNPLDNLLVFESLDGRLLFALRSGSRQIVHQLKNNKWVPVREGLPANAPVALANLRYVGRAIARQQPVTVVPVAAAAPMMELDGTLTASSRPEWNTEQAERLRGAQVEFLLEHEYPTAGELQTIQLLRDVCSQLTVRGAGPKGLLAAFNEHDQCMPPMKTYSIERLERAFFKGLDRYIGAAPADPAALGAHLVQDTITPGLALLFGPSEVGKSTVAASLAAAVASGGTWAGHDCNPGHVLVVVGEDPVGMQLRCDEALENVDRPARWHVVVRAAPFQLYGAGATEGFRRLDDALTHSDARLLIIDTLASLTPGMPENDGAAMTAVVHGFLELISRRPHLTILILHHPPKIGGSARGHGSLRAALDVELQATQKKGYISIRRTKGRNLPGSSKALRFVLRGSGNSVLAEHLDGNDPDESDTAAAADSRILPLLRASDEPLTHLELQARSGLSRSAVYQEVKRFLVTGEIERLRGKVARFAAGGTAS